MQDTLARRLRVLRAERGLTLRDAEHLTGVDKDTLSKLERGLRHPQDVTLAKIAKGYGVPVAELLEEPVPLGEAPEAGAATERGSVLPASPTLTEEAGEAWRDYPYPWMGDVLARTLDRWRWYVRDHQEPKRCHIIAVGCFDVLESVLRFDVPGDTLADRVPEDEVGQRAELGDWLFVLAQRAQDIYVDSKEAEAAEIQGWEERREEMRRRTREIA
jgi:transcriptional regulator with XRE-family HTH domain